VNSKPPLLLPGFGTVPRLQAAPPDAQCTDADQRAADSGARGRRTAPARFQRSRAGPYRTETTSPKAHRNASAAADGQARKNLGPGAY